MLNFLKAFYVYKVGESAGRKPWEDKTLIAALVSFFATIAAKYWGLDISAEEQAGFVTVVVLVFRLISPHVGMRPQTPQEVVAGVPSAPVVDIEAGSPASMIVEEVKEAEVKSEAIDRNKLVDHGGDK
jgi:hypothetical protein